MNLMKKNKLHIQNDKCRRAFTIIEVVLYAGLLALVMTFIVMGFRQVFLGDRLEDMLKETLKQKAASDKIYFMVKSAAKVITPEVGHISNKLTVLRNDGRYETAGMYNVGLATKFAGAFSDTQKNLEYATTVLKDKSIISDEIDKVYVARPFYNLIIFKVINKKGRGDILASCLDYVPAPSQVQLINFYDAKNKNEFEYGDSTLKVSEAFAFDYKMFRENYDKSFINEYSREYFLKEFDKKSNSKNLLASKNKLKEFITKENSTEVGRILLFMAFLCENEYAGMKSISKNKTFIVDEGVGTNGFIDIFGSDYTEYVNNLADASAEFSEADFNARFLPDAGAINAQVRMICEANRRLLGFQAEILNANPPGVIVDELGNSVTIANSSEMSKSIPIKPDDIKFSDGVSACPELKDEKTEFSSIYEIIDSKLPYLSNEASFAKNLNVLYYGVKKIKKAFKTNDGVIHAYDFEIKFPILYKSLHFQGDISFLVKIAANLAISGLPDFSQRFIFPPAIKK